MWPRGKASNDPVFGGFFAQNGDMTGTHCLEESGFLDGPVLITNTHSVGVVRDAYLAWLVRNGGNLGRTASTEDFTRILSWPKPTTGCSTISMGFT